MKIDVVVPEVGESIAGGILAAWLKRDGDYIEEGEDLYEFETDKTTLSVPSTASGVLTIKITEGAEIKIGEVIAVVDPEGKKRELPKADTTAEKIKPAAAERSTPAGHTRAPAAEQSRLSPSVRRIAAEENLDTENIQPTGPKGNITKEDALKASEKQKIQVILPETPPAIAERGETDGETQTRVKMSLIRKRISENLLLSKQSSAHLTTFNEIDMSEVMAIRSAYRDEFLEKFGVKLGFMSFFIKASQNALIQYPEINAFIEGDEIVYNSYYHIGIALSTEKGLMTPVIRNVEGKGFARIEKEIISFIQKVKDKRLLPQELMGGTFTITNGGIFGSLLSTPIPNPPQSAILGMHAINKRPVVINDEVVVRPMMYVALTYDHRIVDGREAVGFLNTVKRLVEDPRRLLLAL